MFCNNHFLFIVHCEFGLWVTLVSTRDLHLAVGTWQSTPFIELPTASLHVRAAPLFYNPCSETYFLPKEISKLPEIFFRPIHKYTMYPTYFEVADYK